MTQVKDDDKLSTEGEQRWEARRGAAAVLRLFIFVFPMVVGFFAGSWAGSLLFEPRDFWGIVLWWGTVVTAATIAATLTDRLARRLLPLTVLLRMTMLFPDRAPSRVRIARRTGNVAELRKRIAEASLGSDIGEMSELILSLSAALSRHDRKTRGHSERVRTYADMLAEEMGIPEEGRDKLRWAALLHDVGKLEVPVDVLNKDGGLESEEWDLIRQHPVNGMKLVAPLLPWLGDWAKTIEHHHEKWDGSGYPHGLKGQEIFLGARIVAVADAYDVMTAGRVYQKPRSPAQARREIAEQAGRHFDPAVARALMNVSLGKLRWATGPLAMLAEIPFIRGLPQTGRDIAAVVTTSSMVAATIATGVMPIPQTVKPAAVVESFQQEFGIGDTSLLADAGGGTGTDETVSGTGVSTTETAVNRPPAIASVSGSTTSGTLVSIPLAVDDPDGDQVTCAMTEAPAVGAATVPADCSRLTFQPPADFVGQVRIGISVTDGSLSVSTIATIEVVSAATSTTGSTTTTTTAPPPTTTTAPPTTTTTAPPTTTTPNPVYAANDSVTLKRADPVAVVAVLANDVPGTGKWDTKTLTIVSGPSHGDASVSGGKIRYDADRDYTGSDSLVYEVCTTDGVCVTATVLFTIL